MLAVVAVPVPLTDSWCSLQTREREDDEMVEALNRYAAQLQKSLLIINDRDVGTYAAAGVGRLK